MRDLLISLQNQKKNKNGDVMEVGLLFDKVSCYLVDPLNEQNGNPTLACAITVIAGIFTLGIAHGLSGLWRYLHSVEQNETHAQIRQIFATRVSSKDSREVFKEANASFLNVHDLEEAKSGKSIIYNESEITFSWNDLNKRFDSCYALISEKAGLPKDHVKQRVQDLLQSNEKNFIILEKLVIVAEKEWIEKNRIKIHYFAVYGDLTD